MYKLTSSEGFYITGRGPAFIVDSIPPHIKDLRDLAGMYVLIEYKGETKEYEILGAVMFRDVNGHLRVEGPQSLLVRDLHPPLTATLD